MPSPPRSRPGSGRRLFLHLAGLLALVLASSAQAADPFAPGRRWALAPQPAAPWIPRACVFTGDGELVWAAAGGASPRVLLASALGVAAPVLFEDTDFAGAIGEVKVSAGPGRDALFSLHQVPSPTASTRATLLRRYDAVDAARGNPFAPRWSYDPGPLVNAPAFLAHDRAATTLFVGFFDAARGEVQLDRVDPSTGAGTGRAFLAGTALRALVVSADGARVAAAAGDRLHVLDAANLGAVLELPLTTSSAALALTADGGRVAFGDGASVAVHEDVGAGWGLAATLAGDPEELPVEVRLSDDGATLAASWWDAVGQGDARLEVVELSSGTVLNSFQQTGGAAGLQNFPAALHMTADGERILFGLWGQGDSRPELLLVERGRAAVFSANLGGSPYALALDPGGTRLVSAAKDAHANHFATTGTLSCFHTGERDLVLLDVPRLGAQTSFALERPRDRPAFVLAGFPAAQPLEHPSFENPFLLDLGRPLAILPTVPVGPDEVRATIPVPLDPALIGADLAAQGWVLGPPLPTASRTVVRPIVF